MLKSTKTLARREFDRGLAQSLGVVALFMLDETSGTMRDLMTGNSVGIGSQTVTVGSDETGNVLKFDGGTASAQRLAFPLPVPSGASTSGALPANSAGFTIMGRFKPTATPAGNPGQFFGIAASANSQASIGVGVDTSLNVGLGWLSAAGAGIICTVAGAVGNFYTVYATSDGARGSAWVNGRPSGSQGTALSNGGAGLLDEIVFGAQHRSAGFLRQAKGNLEWGAVLYGVPMTDDLAKTLYASDFPYNLFKRKRSPWLVAAAGGGTTSGSLSVTFASMTVAAEGTLGPITAQAAVTFSGMTLSAAGVLPIAGEAAVTFAPMTVAGEGVLGAISGEAAITFADMSLQASGGDPNAEAAAFDVLLRARRRGVR